MWYVRHSFGMLSTECQQTKGGLTALRISRRRQPTKPDRREGLVGQPVGFIRLLCGEAERSRDNKRMAGAQRRHPQRRYGGERSRRHNY